MAETVCSDLVAELLDEVWRNRVDPSMQGIVDDRLCVSRGDLLCFYLAVERTSGAAPL